MTMQKRMWMTLGTVSATGVMLLLITVFVWTSGAFGATTGSPVDPGVLRWGFVAAALATGISAFAAAYAVAAVGSAGIGALTERPELFGRILVLVGLAEGIAIYGLIISILILNRLG